MGKPGIANACLLAIASLLAPVAAQSQEAWPAKPVRMIVPFAPRGPTDVAARLLTQKLTEPLGQQVYVENRAGANGTIGSEAVARAAPDGYTIEMGTTGTHSVNFSLYDKPSYDPVKDFAAITRMAVFPNLILMHNSVPAKNIQELIALAKAQPGKLAYASFGSLTLLSGALFTSMAGIDMLSVPFGGVAPMMTAATNNDVQVSVVPVFSAQALLKGARSARWRSRARNAARWRRSILRSPRRACPVTKPWRGTACSPRPGRRRASWTG